MRIIHPLFLEIPCFNFTERKALFHCSSESIVFRNSCLHLFWNEGNKITDVCKIQNDKKCLKMQKMNQFSFLFESIPAVFPPLLALYHRKSSLALKLTSFKYHSLERKQEELLLHSAAEGFLLLVSTLKVKIIHGNVFACKNGSFVSLSVVCDGKVNCPNDNSDESGCVCHGKRNIQEFSCKEVVLKENKKVCGLLFHRDKFGNCHMLLSGNAKQLTNVKYRCNIHKQIQIHLSSSPREMITTNHNNSAEFPCHDGSSVQFSLGEICTYQLNINNQLTPCGNGGHLKNCLNFSCNKLFKCYESYCVPWSYVCDDKWDCPMGEDEETSKACGIIVLCAGMYTCSGKQTCLHIGSVCDGNYDCPLGDDEAICEIDSFPCPENCYCLALIIRCKDIEGIPPGLQMGYLSVHFINCNVVVLDDLLDHFNKAILFDLSRNNISKICNVPLPTSLKKFNLSWNVIFEITTICFVPNSMQDLQLSNNKISQIETNCFAPCKCLNELDLSNNPLTELPSSMFSKQLVLERLILNNIKLVNANERVFSELKIGIVFATNYHICCLAPPMSTCAMEIPWHVSCSSLLSSNSLRISYTTVCVCNIVFNFVCILLHVSQQGVFQSAFIITVVFVNFTEMLYGVYLGIIWITDRINSGLFFLKEEEWRSQSLCFAAFGLVVWYVLLCQCVLFLMSLSRLMVVEFPLDSVFKCTHFVKKLLLSAASGSFLAGFVSAFLSKITTDKLPTNLCLPFVDPFGTVTLIKILTWCVVLTQLITSCLITIMYALLLYSLKKSQKEIAKSQSKQTHNNWFLCIQLVAIVSTNVLCWLPANCIFLSTMFLAKYPVEMVTWTTVVGLSINSVVNPVIFILVWTRQWIKEKKQKKMGLNRVKLP